MNVILAIIASLVGLFVTGSALLTAWFVYRKSKSDNSSDGKTAYAEVTQRLLLRWSLMDTAVAIMFFIGTSFLLVDVIAMIRDRMSYPYYHWGYLLFGIAFSCLGMLFMLFRLVVVLQGLSTQRKGTSLPNHHYEPNHTD